MIRIQPKIPMSLSMLIPMVMVVGLIACERLNPTDVLDNTDVTMQTKIPM